MSSDKKTYFETLRDKTREENSQKMDSSTFKKLLEAGDIGAILAEGGTNLTKQQMSKVKEKAKEQSSDKLLARQMKIAAQPGYKDSILIPLKAKILSEMFSEKGKPAKSSGFLSSMGSSVLESTKERMDPRNILFGGKGMVSATGRKIFGKGYTAAKPKPVDTMKSVSTDLITQQLSNQSMAISIVGKNTMPLRAIARDMNVMRQNVIKLVNKSGGQSATKADMFFRKQSEEELAYENMLGKTGKSPEIENAKKKIKGKDSTSTLGLFTKIILPVAVVFGGLTLAITNGIDSIKNSFENIKTSIGNVVNSILSSIGLGSKENEKVEPINIPMEQIIADLEAIKFDDEGNVVSGFKPSEAPRLDGSTPETPPAAPTPAGTPDARAGRGFNRAETPPTPAAPVPAGPAKTAADFQRTDKDTTPVPVPAAPAQQPRTYDTSPTREAPRTSAAERNAFQAVREAMGGVEAGGKYESSFNDFLAKNGLINTKTMSNVMTPEKWSEVNLGSKKKLTDFTLDEVRRFQMYRDSVSPGTGGLGRYGFMPITLFGAVRGGKQIPGLVQKLGLSMDAKFDKTTQDSLQDLLVRGNIAILRANNVPITPENIYMAQSVGAYGAVWINEAIRAGQGDRFIADILAERSGAKNPQEYKDNLLKHNPQLRDAKAKDFAPRLASSLVNKGGLSQSLIGKVIDTNPSVQVATAPTMTSGQNKAEAVSSSPQIGSIVSQSAMTNTELRAQTGGQVNVINVANVTPEPQQGSNFSFQRQDENLIGLVERMVT